ncbi:FG-GAP repeat domain-containing protein [Streptomyces sp. NPDC058872]|uniref:FG-GAP repeat domain-containing protein n=1 Tax=Streptomyces sp. NPDC058872 TaxID=3346661 RepID=UPI0036A045CC
MSKTTFRRTRSAAFRRHRYGRTGLRVLLATLFAGGAAMAAYAGAPATVASGAGPVSGVGTLDAVAVAVSAATTGMGEVVVADVDGDRVDDVVAVERSTSKLWMYVDAGRAEIGTGGWNGMHDLAGGDFNGDTKVDLVAVEQSTGKLWLYPSVGTGLGVRTEIGTGGWNGMHDLVSGEFTGDGKADVVGVETSTGKLWLYPGNGAGGIASGSGRVEIGSSGWNGMHDLVAMDLGDDGRSDIVAAETSTSKLWLYPGNGAGSIASGSTRVEIGSGGWNGMRDLAGGVFVGSGDDDLVGVEAASGKLFLYPGEAEGLDVRKQIGTDGW